MIALHFQRAITTRNHTIVLLVVSCCNGATLLTYLMTTQGTSSQVRENILGDFLHGLEDQLYVISSGRMLQKGKDRFQPSPGEVV